MRFQFVLSALLLGGCASIKTQTTGRDDFAAPVASTASIAVVKVADVPAVIARPRADVSPGEIYAARPADPSTVLQCPELFATIEAAQPTTVEDALASLTKLRPKFFERTSYAYEAMHDGAGTGYPRATVYGGDARTVLTFNGHPKQKGFERLQVMCFDDKQNAFEFREVVFPKDAASPESIADLTPAEAAQKFVVTEGRGNRDCKQCHDQNARPIWDSAAVWPGVYGGVNDSLFDPKAPDVRPIYSELERLKWSVFQAQAAQKGRYRFTSNVSTRPNGDLTHQLSYLNGRRIVGDLHRLGPAFQPVRYAFANALWCAPRGDRLELKQSIGTGDENVDATFAVLPENADGETREIFLSAYYDQMGKEKRNLAVMKRYGLVQPLPKERFEELRSYYRKMFREENLDLRIAGVDVDQVMSLREIKRVMGPLGVDVENWSMTLHGGYNFDNGAAAPGRTALRATLERPFTETFMADDPELSKAIAAREVAEESGAVATQSLDQEICGQIQRHLVPGPRPASVTQ